LTPSWNKADLFLREKEGCMEGKMEGRVGERGEEGKEGERNGVEGTPGVSLHFP